MKSASRTPLRSARVSLSLRPERLLFFVPMLTALFAGLLPASKLQATTSPPKLALEAPGGVKLVNGIYVWGYDGSANTTVPAGLTDLKAISPGFGHNLALKSDGTVVGWGENSSGQSTPPAGLTDVVAVAAGSGHSLALKSDGTVVAWGQSGQGQITIPVEAQTGVKAIGAGDYHSMAIKNDGSVIAWGANSHGQSTVPAGLTEVVAVTGGNTFSVALKADGTVVAWGSNDSGQSSVPAGLSGVKAIAAGGAHVLALKTDGTIIGWGWNGYSQTIAPANVAAAIVTAIGAGGSSSVATLADGTVVAWGANHSGQTAVEPILNHQIATCGMGNGHTTVLGMPKVEFGGKGVASSTTTTITVKNSGSGNLTVSLPALSEGDTGDFAIDTTGMATTLPYGASTSFTVTFTPTAMGLRRTLVHLTSNDTAHGDFRVLLTGTGQSTDATLSNLFVSRGTLTPAFAANTLEYLAAQPARINSVTVTPIAAQANASLQIRTNGSSYAPIGSGSPSSALPLSPGSQKVEVLVTAQDGITTRTYGVTLPGADDSATGTGNGPVADGTGPDQPGAPLDITFERSGLNSTVTNVAVDFTLSPGHDRMGDLAVTLIAPDGTQHPLFTRLGGSAGLSGTYTFRDNASALLSTTASGSGAVPTGAYRTETAGAATSLATTFTGKAADGTWTLRFQDFADGSTGTVAAAHLYLALNAIAPAITSPTVTQVQTTSARLGATVSTDGYTDVLDRGVVVSATASNAMPALDGPGVREFSLHGTTGVFTVEAGGLTPGTSNTFRGYVRNAQGTAYTAPVEFTTTASAALAIELSDGTVLRNAVHVFGEPYLSSSTPLSNVTAVSQGHYHTLGLKSDGTVAGYFAPSSSGNYGQANVPDELTGVRSIAAGSTYSTALKLDGTITTWGPNAFTQFDTLPTLTDIHGIATSPAQALTVGNDGTVLAFGENGSGQGTIPAGLTGVRTVVSTGYCALALRSDGSLVTWGYEANGVNAPPAGIGRVKAIAAGNHHFLAVRDDGTVAAWGYLNRYGETMVPPGLRNVKAVAAGDYHNLALKTDGTVVAWGRNNHGEVSGPLTFTGVEAIAAARNSSAIVAMPNLAFGGVTVSSSSSAQVLTLRNTGSNALTISAVRLAGGNAANFTLDSAAMTASVEPGASTAISVTFTPSATGPRSTDLEIVSNDPDRAIARVRLQGTGNPASNTPPVLAVSLRNKTSTSATVVSTLVHNGGLTVSNSPFTRGFVYSVASVNPEPIVGGTGVSSQGLTTSWAGGGVGTLYDLQEGETYAIRSLMRNSAGYGYSPVLLFTAASAPEISVVDAASSTPLTALAFGTTGATKTVTIRNDGATPLDLASVRLHGTHTGEFSLDTSSLTTPLAAGASTSVAVTFTPAGPALSTSTLRILSNDDDEPFVDIAVTGNEVIAPAASPPVVTTPTFANVAPTTATLGGTIASDGGSPITERGIVWTNSNPGQEQTIGGVGAHQVIASGTDTGVFTVHVTGLPATGGGIFFRAYAINAEGTSYSDAGSFLSSVGSPIIGVEQSSGASVAEVVVWGDNTYGQANMPADLTNVKAIAGGDKHTLALKNDGSVVAWGESTDGKTEVPSSLTGVRVTAIAAGAGHSVALTESGSVVAWGSNGYDQTTVPASALSGVTAIAAGRYHTVALKDDGSVVAWGENSFGQINVPSSALSNVKAIASGDFHCLALKQDGSVISWGNDSAGQTTIPAGITDVKALAAGWGHNLALKNDGTVFAWGFNIGGAATVPAGLTGVTAIAASDTTSMALKSDGTVVTWGEDIWGSQPAGMAGAIAIARGTYHAVALTQAIAFDPVPVLAGPTGNGSGDQPQESGGAAPATTGASSTTSLTVTNDGTLPLTLSSVTLTGTNAGDFSVTQPDSPIAPGDSSTFEVSFTPTASGARSAMLQIVSNASNQPTYNLALSGTGTPPPPPIMYSFQSAVPGQTTATLSGQVMMNNGPAITERGVVYALTSVNDSPVVGGPGVIKVPHASVGAFETFSVDVSGLTPETAYSFRAYATSPAGSGHSSLGQFTTLEGPKPEIELEQPAQGTDFGNQVLFSSGDERTFIIHNTGTANLTVTSVSVVDGNSGDFAVYPLFPLPATVAPNGTFIVNAAFSPQALGARSTTLRVLSNDSDEGTLDLTLTGTGVANAPLLQSVRLQYADVTTMSAGSTIFSDGGAPVTERGVVYATAASGINPALNTPGAIKVVSGDTTPFFTSYISGLQPGTQYRIRAYATNAAGTGYTNQDSFTTKTVEIDVQPPASTDYGEHWISSTTPKSFLISNSGNGDMVTSVSVTGDEAGDFEVEGGSEPFEIYSHGYREVTVNFKPTAQGARSAVLHILSTDTDEPDVAIPLTGTGTAIPVPVMYSTQSVGFGRTTATFYGQVMSNDGPPITERGVVYAPTSVNSSPTVGGPGVTKVAHASVGGFEEFSTPVTGLTPGTEYSYRHYATNAGGTGYANQGRFTTPAIRAPIVGQILVDEVGITTFTAGATINDDGGASVTERGLVYIKASDGSSPLIGGANVTKVTSADTTAAFMVNVTGATPETAYWVRFYATNSEGTGYTGLLHLATQAPMYPEIRLQGPEVAFFGDQNIDRSTDPTSFYIWNDGSAPLNITNVSIVGDNAGDFSITSEATPFSVASTWYGLVEVRFTPTELGVRTATLRITSNDSDEPTIDIPLNGTGLVKLRAPVVTTPTKSNITNTFATLGGTLEDRGDGLLNELGVLVAKTSDETDLMPDEANVMKFTVPLNWGGETFSRFNVNVPDLEPDTSYTFRAFAQGENGYGYSETATFTTDENGRIEISVQNHSGIDYPSGGTFRFEPAGLGNGNYEQMVIKNVGSETLQISDVTLEDGDTEEFSIYYSGSHTLEAGQGAVLYVNFYPDSLGEKSATVRIQSNDADEGTFDLVVAGEAVVGVPYVDEPRISKVGDTKAKLGAEVIRDGGAEILERGVIVSEEAVNDWPDLESPGIMKFVATGTLGVFSVNASGLTPGTRYVFRGYATNSAGTNYSWVQNLTTLTPAGDGTLKIEQPAGTPFGGNVLGWGNYETDPLPTDGLSGYSAVARGPEHSLALRNGKVTIWGWDEEGEAEPQPGLTDVTSIAAGYEFSAAVKSDGTVVTWGAYEPESAQSLNLTNVASVVSSQYDSFHIAVKQDGTVVPWGDEPMTMPPDLSDIRSVAIGRNHGLALTNDGHVIAFGEDHEGDTEVPADLVDVVAVAAGYNFSLALKNDGTLRAWGEYNSSLVEDAEEMSDVVSIAAGRHFAAAVKSDGSVHILGYDYTDVDSVPQNAKGIRAISCSKNTVLAIYDGISFGRALAGGPTVTRTLTLTNTGTGPLTINDVSIEGLGRNSDGNDEGGEIVSEDELPEPPPVFSIVQEPLAPIAPGESATLTIGFTPPEPGNRFASLVITTDDAASRSVSIPLSGTGVPPSHPPVAEDVVITIFEDRSLKLADAIQYFDEDNDYLTGIKIATLPTAGAVWDGVTQVTVAGTIVSPDATYVPAPDASGPDYDSFTFQVIDSGLDGDNMDLTPRSFSINVNAATEPPMGTDKSITVPINGRYTFTAADFGFSDPNDTPPNEFIAVKITQVPPYGSLYINGDHVYGSRDRLLEGDDEDLPVVHLKPVPGQTWKFYGSSHRFTQMAASADGSRLVAASDNDELFTSTDGGKTWTPRASAGSYTAVAISSDGLKMLAATSDGENSGALYTSTDGGVTWTPRTLNGNWTEVAISADGSTLVAADYGFLHYDAIPDDWVSDGGQIHVSTDGGATWTPQGDARLWTHVACSADGSRLIASALFDFVYTSSNGGQTWSQSTGPGEVRGVTCSADGLKLALCTSDGVIATSIDGGITWSQHLERQGEASWRGIAASADGRTLLLHTGNYHSLYFSRDGGTTWTEPDAWATFTAVAVAGDGSRLLAPSMYDNLAVSDTEPDELEYRPGKGFETPPTSDSFKFAVQDDGTPAGSTDTTPNTIHIEFGPPIPPPAIINLAATNLTATGATASAQIVADPQCRVDYAGFMWAKTAENPELNWSLPVSYNEVSITSGNAISAVLSGLETGVSYTLKAWVDSSTGYIESDSITFTPGVPDRPLAVGNLVFFDRNDNGHADAGEGVNNVTVLLYTAAQVIGTDEPFRTATTADGGFWLIDTLPPGSYRLFIPPTMFAGSAPLYRMKSVAGVMPIGDDHLGEKGEDAVDPAITGVRSEVFTLAADTMPAGDSELGLRGDSDNARDGDVDLTRDFGFIDVRERPATFEEWKQQNGIPGGGHGPDQNNDGRDDLLDYAMGKDKDSDTDAEFKLDDNHTTDQTHLLLRTRRGGNADLTFIVQFRPNLTGAQSEWEETIIQPTVTINDDGTETLTFPNIQTDPALGGSTRGFARVVVQLDADHDGTPEASAVSAILGWQHRGLEVKTQTYALPFVRPAVYQGVVDTVTGSTLGIADSSGVLNIGGRLVAGERYYVEVVGGDHEGQRIDVDASATTATSIALVLSSEFSTLSSLPATLAGDTIALRPHWRVKDIFPPADYTPGTTAANSDQIQLWSAAQAKFVPLLLGNHPTKGRMWVAVGSSASENDRVIGPADGLFVKPRQNVLAATDGQVRTWKFACPLRAGSNLIGNPYPVDQSFSQRLMTLANGFSGSILASDSDRVNAWSGDSAGGTGTPGYVPYTLSPTGVWTRVGEVPMVNRTADKVFTMGTAAFITSKNGNPGWVLPAPVIP